MDRLTRQHLNQLLDFLREVYACQDQEAFVSHLLSALPTLIPSEITGYNEIQIESRTALEATRFEPSSAQFPDYWQIFEAYLPEHPFSTYIQQTHDRHAIRISDFLTQRQFHRLGLYNEFFRRQDVEYQMAAWLAGPAPCEIAMTLNRSRRDFSERERLLLNLLRPHLAQAYANILAINALHQEVRLLQQGLQTNGQELVVLTKAGQVRQMAARAHGWLAAYFGPMKGERLPEALRAWLRHQEAALERADDAPPPREPLRIERERTYLLVRHLCEAEHCLLLLEERPTAGAPTTVARDGLTQREVEVLQWVAQGKTNTEVGIILGVSPKTVKKHLEHIYEKLGVETRLAAVTVALGGRSGA